MAEKPKTTILKILTLLLVTLLCVVIIVFGVVWVLLKGPSPSVTDAFIKSLRETSALRWVPGVFLSQEEIDKYKSEDTSNLATDDVDTNLISLSSVTTDENLKPIEIIEISSGTSKGKLMIVKDPKRVILGTSGQFGKEPGLTITDMVEKYDGVAGINAGGFEDEAGQGDGGTPTGLVISDGTVMFGDKTKEFNIIGIDSEGILYVGTMTGEKALEKNIKWGVSFKTHDGLASALIINGEVQKENLSGGVNPRTAIGQRSDGALLLLVMDGRSIDSLGATMEDVVNVMLEYGAVNAGNLDGGSSSVMVYEGEIINNCASITGPRHVPTGFIVLKEGDQNE